MDLAYVEPSQVEELKKEGADTAVYEITTADYRCVMFNFAATDVFADKKVRQALCYDTNRQAVVDSIVHGYGDAAYTPLQRNEFRTDDVERYDYDPERPRPCWTRRAGPTATATASGTGTERS